MRKIFNKYFACIGLMCIMLVCIFLGFRSVKTEPIHFVIETSDSVQKISVYDGGDGFHYVFLPSYAELDMLSVSLAPGVSASINNVPLTSETDFSELSLETPYAYKIKGQKDAAILFYRSQNTASVDIVTASGSMRYVHSEKGNSEFATVAVYSSDGQVDCVDREGQIRGRGNATWTYYEKKPYLITLSSDKPVLGMESASKWVLLANAVDETNLNNKLVHDLAEECGFCWMPDCRYVDVYLNGEYNGLYLLFEKVEVGESRLALDAEDAFLCKNEHISRADSLANPFLTDAGRMVEVNIPENGVYYDMERVHGLINKMESEILSGNDLSSSEILDLDSWVYKYIIDETFANHDADQASSYFYYTGDIFKAGPLWDYDRTLGNNNRTRYPTAYIAKSLLRSDTMPTMYYDALVKNSSFSERMTEIWRDTVLPLLEEMIDRGIAETASEIEAASRMNSLRWRTMFERLRETGDVFPMSPSDIRDYLSRRVEFLSDAWINGTEYCTVQFEVRDGTSYLNVSVKKGELLDTADYDLLDFALYDMPEDSLWYVDATGEPMDFTKPITEDMILTAAPNFGTANDARLSFATKDLIAILCVAAFAVFLTAALITDIRARSMERRSYCVGKRK